MPPSTGVAVATAYCPLETAAVVDAGDWTFGVPPTGIVTYTLWAASGRDLTFVQAHTLSKLVGPASVTCCSDPTPQVDMQQTEIYLQTEYFVQDFPLLKGPTCTYYITCVSLYVCDDTWNGTPRHSDQPSSNSLIVHWCHPIIKFDTYSLIPTRSPLIGHAGKYNWWCSSLVTNEITENWFILRVP